MFFASKATLGRAHDFMDFLVGEAFLVKVWAGDKRAIRRAGQSADEAATLQPASNVLEEPADAGPEEGVDADHDDSHDDGHAQEDAQDDDGDVVVGLVVALEPTFKRF